VLISLVGSKTNMHKGLKVWRFCLAVMQNSAILCSSHLGQPWRQATWVDGRDLGMCVLTVLTGTPLGCRRAAPRLSAHMRQSVSAHGTSPSSLFTKNLLALTCLEKLEEGSSASLFSRQFFKYF